MYIRQRVHTLKSGEKRIGYGLLECRRIGGEPKQKTILNLGRDFDIAERDWPAVTRHVLAALRGQRALPLEDEKIRAAVDDIVRRLRAKAYDVDAGRDDRDAVITDEIHHPASRTVGGERVGLQALAQLGFADLLRSLGMRDDHIRVATALVVGRMLSPGSELHTYDWMAEASAILELLALELPGESTLYRTGDRLYALREEVMAGLFGTAQALLGFSETIVFYDLTNVHYHGRKKGTLLRYGRSKQKRSDCVLVTLALTIDQTGFVRSAEVLPGNASEPRTLKRAIEKLRGTTPTVILDAGIATEANLAYLKEKQLDWICVQRSKAPPAPKRTPDEEVETKGGVRVKAWTLSEAGTERRVYLQSEARKATGDSLLKDKRAKFEAALTRLHAGLSKPGYTKDYEKVLLKVGRLLERHNRVSYQYKVRAQRKKGTAQAEAVTFTHESAYDERTQASGGYVVRTSHVDWSAERIAQTYWQLSDIERTFRTLKSELGLRPIYHSKDERIEAHLFLSVLAYHAVHLIRTKLKAKGLHCSWRTLQFELNQWHRITTVLPENKDTCILLKKDTDLSPFQRQIARIMGLKPDNHTYKTRTNRPTKV